jgi:hypothetical protein
VRKLPFPFDEQSWSSSFFKGYITEENLPLEEVFWLKVEQSRKVRKTRMLRDIVV